MKIKRYSAPDVRQALRLVREELGPDAVIISSRRSAEGVAVIAATDVDAASMLSPEELEQRFGTEARADPARRADSGPRTPGVDHPVGTGTDEAADGSMDDVRREVRGLRALLEAQLASPSWSGTGRRDPERAALLGDLAGIGLDPALAREVADGLEHHGSRDGSERRSIQALAARLLVQKDDLLERGGTVAVVGATGVGKTTTVAKLAARYVMRHGPDEACLVSTDTYRIGAREQLLSYARILGVPLFVAADRQELATILAAQAWRKLVLIDTAGMSQRDARLAEQFELLRSQGARTRILLALSAASDLPTLDELVVTYGRVAPGACVLTKLDEAASLGAAISTLARHRLPLSWCTNGQRVPEDIHPAHDKQTWLVTTAFRLARGRRSRRDDRIPARRDAEVPAHA